MGCRRTPEGLEFLAWDPGNITLGKSGETVVVDWGLAKVLGQADVEATEGTLSSSGDSSLAQTGEALGTPVFVSPEQAQGKLNELGPASDVYGLGGTLYRLLTGQAPSPEGDKGGVLGKVQRGDFPPPRQVNARVPAALEAVCLKALALAPQDRYPSPRELAEETEHWLADEPVQVHREPWLARRARAVRKRPALTAGIGALLVTGVIALGVSTLLIGRGQRDTPRALSDLKTEQQQRVLAPLAALRTAAPDTVPGILADLHENRSQVLPDLRDRYASEKEPGLRMGLALALVEVEPETVRDQLAQRPVQADDPAEVLLVRKALTPHAGALKEGLWRQARDPDGPLAARFRALAALVAFDGDNPAWKDYGALAAEPMMQANPLHLLPRMEAFRPVQQAPRPTLAEVFRGQKLKESRRGSFVDAPESVRSAARSGYPPGVSGGYFGLPVCRTTEAPAAPEPPPVKGEALVPGRFGSALDARVSSAEAAGRPEYSRPPLTVECWARLFSKARFNVLVAKDLKASADHWEVYTYAHSGAFSAYLPGYAPAEIKSGVDVTDGRWHYLAMTFDGRLVRLHVDGRLVKETAVKRVREGGPAGALWFGKYPEFGIGCDGLVDEVRLSRGVRPLKGVPNAPLTVDADTLGLWHFDSTDLKRVKDASRLDNPAVLQQPGHLAAAPKPADVAYDVADPELKLVKIDHSPDESFLSLRVDSAGRLFVGCREAVFAYEPDGKGGYGPRQLLYRFPPDSWVNDVEVRGDDLYCMTNAALYVLPGGRRKRTGLVPRRLVWGTPVDMHVTYHGLAWGPQGDLYFTSGDPLLTYGDFQNRPDHWGHWTVYCGPKKEQVPFTGVGGFYRVRPDGSGFQVVAQGTRGSFGLAFDRQWDLFSNDNDHESIPSRYVPGRLLHAAPHAHFFWPRGWMAEKTPERADLLRTIYAGMGRAVPVGQAYCDEPFLPLRYRNNLLVAEWGQRRIDRYPLAPRGASFAAEPHALLTGAGSARPVGIAVGRGGRLFAAISHLPANAFSPKYPSDLVMITRRDDAPPYSFDACEVTEVPPARLWKDLSSPSLHARQQAHQEILRRGRALLEEAVARLRACKEDPAQMHLPWLAGLSGSPEASKLLQSLAAHAEPRVRLQAIRVLAECPGLKAPRRLFVAALADADLQVRHAALVSFFTAAGALPDEVLTGPARSADTYLRQTSAFLLARRGRMEQLEDLCSATDAPGRLAGILAAGFRLTVPPPDSTPPADLPLHVRRGGTVWDARTVLQYANATVDLEKLGRVGSFPTAESWARGKHTAEQRRLFELLVKALDDKTEGNRLQAAYFLSLLNDARSEPRVAQVRAAAVSLRLTSAPLQNIAQVWAVGPFPEGKGNAHPPERGAVDLAARYQAGGRTLEWKTVPAKGRLDLPRPAGWSGPGTFYLYYRLHALQPEQAELLTAAFDRVKVWHNGTAVPEGKALRLDLQPGSNDVLVRVRTADGQAAVALQYRATGRVEAVLPERLGLGTLAERLRSAAGKEIDLRPFLALDWSREAARGDAERGRKLFGADGLGCVKCHGILPAQNAGGAPNLADAARRFTVAHLVESILLPGKQVAPVFRATHVETKTGVTLTGLVVAEDAKRLVLLLPDATRRELAHTEIEARRVLETSAMPAGLVRRPDELRDLLAYLLAPSPKAP